MDRIADYINDFLNPLAEISAAILELIGIIIIIVGSARALVLLFKHILAKGDFSIANDLGRALSLALEFKMGAEIIKTVIIHNLEELAILGSVIIIRALLAFIIHFEIHSEKGKFKRKNKEKSD